MIVSATYGWLHIFEFGSLATKLYLCHVMLYLTLPTAQGTCRYSDVYDALDGAYFAKKNMNKQALFCLMYADKCGNL